MLYVSAYVSVRWYGHTMWKHSPGPNTLRPQSNATRLQWLCTPGRVKTTVIQSRSPCICTLLNLLFILHQEGREIDEGPFSLSRASHTSSLAQTHIHMHTFEGDGWWCMAVKMQRDRQGFWMQLPIPHSFPPHRLCTSHYEHACLFTYLCLYACMSTHVYKNLY